jgi:3-phenylpropionate/trans-cinnamate dioxygenase ferredoxin subunit
VSAPVDDAAGAVHTVDVGAVDDLADGEGTRVVVEGRAVSLVRIGDDVYAIGDRCSHADVSLSGGEVDEDACTIECPKHGSEFDLRTGEALTLPAVRPVPTYDVRVEDGRVLLSIGVEGEEVPS